MYIIFVEDKPHFINGNCWGIIIPSTSRRTINFVVEASKIQRLESNAFNLETKGAVSVWDTTCYSAQTSRKRINLVYTTNWLNVLQEGQLSSRKILFTEAQHARSRVCPGGIEISYARNKLSLRFQCDALKVSCDDQLYDCTLKPSWRALQSLNIRMQRGSGKSCSN